MLPLSSKKTEGKKKPTSQSAFYQPPNLLFTNQPKQVKQVKDEETPLVVQWLRLRAPNAGGLASIPGQGVRACTPQLRTGAAQSNKH